MDAFDKHVTAFDVSVKSICDAMLQLVCGDVRPVLERRRNSMMAPTCRQLQCIYRTERSHASSAMEVSHDLLGHARKFPCKPIITGTIQSADHPLGGGSAVQRPSGARAACGSSSLGRRSSTKRPTAHGAPSQGPSTSTVSVSKAVQTRPQSCADKGPNDKENDVARCQVRRACIRFDCKKG